MHNLFTNIASPPQTVFRKVNSKNKKHAFLFKVEATKIIIKERIQERIAKLKSKTMTMEENIRIQ